MTAPRRRWSFGLRTLFVVVTLMGCWLWYSLDWIRRRHAYLNEHPSVVSEWNVRPAPWSLRPFGEAGIKSLTAAKGGGEREQRSLVPEAALWVPSVPGERD